MTLSINTGIIIIHETTSFKIESNMTRKKVHFLKFLCRFFYFFLAGEDINEYNKVTNKNKESKI